jgi:hypothetical protein
MKYENGSFDHANLASETDFNTSARQLRFAYGVAAIGK